MGKPRSLVLVTVDCLRADHVGFMGYARPTTPFLDSLGAESLRFANTVVAGAPTYYSFPAIMASRYPLALGRDVIGLSPTEPTIATVLNQAGYSTAAFVAGNPYLSSHFGYSTGFETYRDFLDIKVDEIANIYKKNGNARSHINRILRNVSHKVGPLGALYEELYFRYSQREVRKLDPSLDQLRRFPSADVIVDHARDWLSNLPSGPFFLWLHFMDPHGPYYPSQEALNLMGQTTTATRACYLNSYWNRFDLHSGRLERFKEEVIGLYDSGIRWVDQQLNRLTGALRERGLWNDCIFALTGDHGEEFLEHGGRYHRPPNLTEELAHVPLLLCVPGTHAKRVDDIFSLLHLAPTLLDIMQVAAPADFHGRSYWPQLEKGQPWGGDAVLECVPGCLNPFRPADRCGPRILAVRESHYKLVLDFRTSAEQLFDQESDPGELHPLPFDKERPMRRHLLERARRHIADSRKLQDSELRVVLRLHNALLEKGGEV